MTLKLRKAFNLHLNFLNLYCFNKNILFLTPIFKKLNAFLKI